VDNIGNMLMAKASADTLSQHTSAYADVCCVSIRQHLMAKASADEPLRQHTSAYASIKLRHTLAYASIQLILMAKESAYETLRAYTLYAGVCWRILTHADVCWGILA
jgi:hypothetical protein